MTSETSNLLNEIEISERYRTLGNNFSSCGLNLQPEAPGDQKALPTLDRIVLWLASGVWPPIFAIAGQIPKAGINLAIDICNSWPNRADVLKSPLWPRPGSSVA
jgi:hypothetical protein